MLNSSCTKLKKRCLFSVLSQLDHGPESRTSQARSAQRCRMRSFSLHEAFVKQARDSARQGALRKLVGASWSAQVSTQVALCNLLCASCSAQVAPASWFFASGSLQVALCKLRSLQVALCKMLCASCSVQVALRKLLCASCFKMQVASCDARPRTREESNPRPAGSGSRRASHETTPEDQFEQHRNRKKPRVFAPRPRRSPQRVSRAPQKSQKTMGYCTSTTPITAEGCASTAEIAKNLQFLHLDHADPRRGLREHRRNRKRPRVFAPRPRRSPQRVAREL